MSFRDILGHSKQINILKRAITGSRVAHSYLFAGPEGVGKMLVARAFAKALNCETPHVGGEGVDEGVDSCGACASCRAMEDGFHINLVKVEPVDGVVKIDQVRDLQNAMKYRVTEGRRVAIVINQGRFQRIFKDPRRAVGRLHNNPSDFSSRGTPSHRGLQVPEDKLRAPARRDHTTGAR
jgi:DNA polymerase III delta prime subunit